MPRGAVAVAPGFVEIAADASGIARYGCLAGMGGEMVRGSTWPPDRAVLNSGIRHVRFAGSQRVSLLPRTSMNRHRVRWPREGIA